MLISTHKIQKLIVPEQSGNDDVAFVKTIAGLMSVEYLAIIVDQDRDS